MAELKREYVVPLRTKCRTAPKWRRSKKAVSVLREFIKKHMKTDEVILCSELNEHIWANGSKNPPGKVSVIALKTKIGNNEKTLVNLTEIGVDKHLATYAAATPAAASKSEKTEETEEIKDAEVKEVPSKEEKTEEKKSKEETKKEEKPKKKETVKNE